MTALVDSLAEFRARALALNLDSNLVDDLSDRGWGTFAGFAYSSAYQPSQSDETPFLAGVLTPLLGGDPTVDPRTPALRRLLYESWTLVTSDLRRRVEQTPEDRPRRLPLQERHARMERLRKKLTGVRIQDDLEPSNALIDEACALVEDGSVSYLRWSSCTKRSQEVDGVKKTKEWRADREGFLKEHITVEQPAAELGDLLKLRFALQRRGLALEVAGVMQYLTHELLADWLMKALTKDALPGYKKPTLVQAELADRHVWKRLAEETRSGLAPQPNGWSRAESALPDILKEAEANYLLAQLPGATSHAGTSSSSGGQKRKAEPSNQQPARKQSRTDRGGRSRGKGAGKGPMPPELRGMNSKTSTGQPICFAYNTRGCSTGPRCQRGVHVCAKPGCEGPHPLKECPKQS